MRTRVAIVVGVFALPFVVLASCFPDYGFQSVARDGAPGDTTMVPDQGGGEAPPADTQEASSADSTPDSDAATTSFYEAGTYTIRVLDDASSVTSATVTLNYGFSIDDDEVTVAQFRAWVAAGKQPPCDGGDCEIDQHFNMQMIWSSQWNTYLANTDYEGATCQPVDLDGGTTYSLDAGDLWPINCVNWAEAEAYCMAQQKRLPTQTEWTIAAESRALNYYPWGDVPSDDAGCSYATSVGCPWPVPIRTASLGRTSTGVYDLAGSVQEWCWDYIADIASYVYPVDAGLNYAGPPHLYDGGSVVWSGLGNYFVDSWYGHNLVDTAHAVNSSGDPDLGWNSLGFRCARSQ